ncbi:MAG: carbonic anhydrase [Candidatus Thermoplasmatota archaeon]|jgi:carbonic anhydrase|nr:carbonic anhydrase [Candidatus Thermoplasmatota archaeon]MDP7265009.1 carbonic anhydrase [Candidatus Thermoplasmatota archaeon]
MNAGSIIQNLLWGNNEFVESHNRDYFAPHMNGQNTFITMLSCSDSRVQPRLLLPDAINRIFAIENIGNQISAAEGSVDYGIYHLKTPVLMILGHSECGAIKAVMAGYADEPAPIKAELDRLSQAISLVKAHLLACQTINPSQCVSAFQVRSPPDKLGEPSGSPLPMNKDSDPEKRLLDNIIKNIDYQVGVGVSKYNDLVKNEKLAVVGAFYDFRNELGEGYGRLIIINVNGEKDSKKIENTPVFAGTENDLIFQVVGS